jgi:glycosyltransferase involved in cell wall biosynthesis
MSAQPLVSVGVPTYNRPRHLARALQSLMNQTYRNLEIIVSDNCSPDSGVETVAREAMGRDPRIRYVRQSANIGAVENFQYVLMQAGGKYFCWAADDDLCNAQFVEKLVACLEAHPDLVLAACDVEALDDNDLPQGVHHLDTIRLSADWRKARSLFFRYPISNIFFCIYGMYRTEAVQARGARSMAGWRGYATNGEVPFLAQLAVAGRIAAIPEVLKLYRRHPDSLYHSEVRGFSRIDALMIRLVVRARLVRIALAAPQSVRIKLGLLLAIIASFLAGIRLRALVASLLPARVRAILKAYAAKLPHLRR